MSNETQLCFLSEVNFNILLYAINNGYLSGEANAGLGSSNISVKILEYKIHNTID